MSNNNEHAFVDCFTAMVNIHKDILIDSLVVKLTTSIAATS